MNLTPKGHIQRTPRFSGVGGAMNEAVTNILSRYRDRSKPIPAMPLREIPKFFVERESKWLEESVVTPIRIERPELWSS
jgi:hypothetical protein